MARIALCSSVMAAMLLAGGCSTFDADMVTSAMTRYGLFGSPRPASATIEARRPSKVRSDAPPGQAGWLAANEDPAQRPEGSSKSPAEAETFTPWRQRRGPAYPGDFWRSFGQDAREFPATLWDDTKATVTNPLSLIGIGAAGVTGIVINASGSDNRVADHFTRHGSQLGDFWDGVGDVGGNPGTHFAVAGAMYLASLARNDVKTYEVSKTLINALAINGMYTLALKGIVRTRSPNGDPCGWPSGHTSSSFCFATVMHEEYGPLVGLPLFAFASFVGYERIDARNHDFSDVISGALLGMAIGHAVARNHEMKVFGMQVVPYADASRDSLGVALVKEW